MTASTVMFGAAEMVLRRVYIGAWVVEIESSQLCFITLYTDDSYGVMIRSWRKDRNVGREF